MNAATNGLSLDTGTLVFSLSVLALLMAAITFNSARRNPGMGMVQQGCAMACLSIGYLLVFFRGHAPWFVTYFIANTFVLMVGPFSLTGFARVFNAKLPKATIAVVTAFGMAGVSAAFFWDASNRIAIFSLSSAVAYIGACMALMIYKNRDGYSPQLVWLAITSMVITAVAYGARGVLALVNPVQVISLTSNLMPQFVAHIGGAVYAALSTICFIGFVEERRQRETVGRLRRDALTGLFTRTAFHEMTAEIDSFGKTEGYSIVMLDIDHFKLVNDSFGHAGGDLALAHAARLIGNSIRLTDIAVRFGGEEFCVVMRGCPLKDAAHFAERVVTDARKQLVRLRDGRDIAFTFSAGYAYKAPHWAGNQTEESLEEVIERADQALYRAKHGGRNQAVSAHGDGMAGVVLA